MPFPPEEFIYHGGCNCRAIRYKVIVPEESQRPPNPYGVSAPPQKLPMAVICHCNDCRRAHGQMSAYGILNKLEWVQFSFDGSEFINATSLFDKVTGPVSIPQTSSLTFFKKTPNRARGFCRTCGTPLLYFAFATPDKLPEWWFPQLDISGGTVDRDDLSQAMFKPDRELWTDFGLDWALDLLKHGTGNGSRAGRAFLEDPE